MEAMRRKIMEEQLAAIEQARRQQEQASSSSSNHTAAPSSSSSSSSASNPTVSSLPHRNKHAPPPKVKLYQPPLMPYIPPSNASHPRSGAMPQTPRGSGSRADPIVFGESSPIGARQNPFQSAPQPTSRQTNTSAASSSNPSVLPRPPSSQTSSYAASQPFRSPNSKSSQKPFISPKSTPLPLKNNNPFYHSPLSQSLASKSRSKANQSLYMSDDYDPFSQSSSQSGSRANQSLFMGDDYEPSGPVNTMYSHDVAAGLSVDAATRDKQIQDLLSNMVNVTEVSEDAKTSAKIAGLKCMLLPHQVQGVTWMREREKGSAKGGILADDMGLGKTVQTLALIVSNRPGQQTSTIDLEVPAEAPKRGKKAAAANNETTKPPEELPRREMPSKTTLIVAPLSVIKQWEREVIEKTDAGLKVYLYHGSGRAKKASHFTKFDIVITTYNTVASEYNNYMSTLEAQANGTLPSSLAMTKTGSKAKAKSKPKNGSRSNGRTRRADSDADSVSGPLEIDSEDSDDSFGGPMTAGKAVKKVTPTPLFEFPWLRIVLDEAHNIKNHKTKQSRACFLLAANAVSRWCLTGTPLQNDAFEMFSLIHFLRVPPFNDFQHFKEKIGEPLKSNNQNRVNWGMKRLTFVLQTIMLRRAKDAKTDDGKPILNLPGRNLELIELEFDSPQEKDFYVGLQETIKKAFEKEEEQSRATGKKTNMIASLVLLLRLRQACSHPAMVTGSLRVDAGAIGSAVTAEANSANSSQQATVEADDDDDDDGLAAMLSGLSVVTKRCEQCNVELPRDASTHHPDATNGSGDLMAAVNPNLANRRLCIDCTKLASNHSQDLFATSFGSTKIRKMLALLSAIRSADRSEKTIVFSQFTSFLNIVEPHLKRHSYRYVRYDGSMKPQDRESALEQICNDPSVTVILISFKAGSTGLNLTSCSRVILMDLWWNPQIEEQAFDRAHRLGQTRDVTIYKLSIKDTVEERILRLQEKKRALAKAALEGSKLVKGNKLDAKEIWSLFNGTDH